MYVILADFEPLQRRSSGGGFPTFATILSSFIDIIQPTENS